MKQVLTLVGTILLLSSCESKAGTGALVGAGAGALAGGLIGGNAAGVLIGGAAGAVGGALIGAALDSADRDKLQENSPQTLQRIDSGQQLTIHDVEALAKNGVNDDIIIAQIQNTRSVFHLTSGEIIDLKDSGVSEKVIEYMMQTAHSSK